MNPDTETTDEFRQAELRLQATVERLQQCDPIEISGIVLPGGVSAGHEEDDSWLFQLCLQPWKTSDNELVDNQLIVQKLADEQEVDELMDTFEDYKTVRLKVRYSDAAQDKETNALTREYALLEELLPYVADSELEKTARQLQEPVVKHDSFFGELILNRAVNWYEAGQEWGQKDIRVYLSLDACTDEDLLVRQSKQLWKRQKKLNKQVLDLATKDLLKTKNDSWLEENEQPLKAAEFKQRLELESITIQQDGRFEFCYDDNNMFWGHTVIVSGSLENGPDNAALYG